MGDWMIYKDDKEQVIVECRKCGYRVPFLEEIPAICPVCKSQNMEKEVKEQ